MRIHPPDSTNPEQIIFEQPDLLALCDIVSTHRITPGFAHDMSQIQLLKGIERAATDLRIRRHWHGGPDQASFADFSTYITHLLHRETAITEGQTEITISTSDTLAIDSLRAVFQWGSEQLAPDTAAMEEATLLARLRNSPVTIAERELEVVAAGNAARRWLAALPEPPETIQASNEPLPE